MKAMTAHICATGNASELGTLMREEIATNKQEASANPQWSVADRDAAFFAMDAESSRIDTLPNLYSSRDSVKGETAMEAVYPEYSGKAVDAITLHDGGDLVLMEAKYLIRVGGRGPFGGPASFKSRVSEKFNEMAVKLVADNEMVRQLRIVVVTDAQLPFSINHIHKLLNAGYPPGSFSSDCNRYNYVLCSSSSLRMMVDGVARGKKNTQDYLFFTI